MSNLCKVLEILFVSVFFCKVTKQMDQWGKEFLLSFPPNYNVTGEVVVYVTSRDAATVCLENSLFNASWSYSLAALSSVRIPLPSSLMYREQNVTSLKAVYLNATSDVSVYVLNYRKASGDMYTAYPMKTMGTEYLLAGYTPGYNAFFLVTASQDNTTVRVQLKVSDSGSSCLGGRSGNGSVLSAVLQRRHVWGGSCTRDFTGSVVTSDKPITVVTAMDCATVPSGVHFCDHMVEMMPPVADYGATYVLHNITYRQSGVIYRVVSGRDGAVVRESTGGNRTLNKGQFMDYDLGQLGSELCVFSSSPLMTLMYTKGDATDPAVPLGDPSMAVVPAVERFTSQYVVNLEISPTETLVRYVSIIINSSAVAGLALPGKATFNPICLGYSVAHVALNSSTNVLQHQSGYPFGAVLYAFANMTGISLPAGIKLTDKYDYCSSGPCLNEGTCSNVPDTSTFACSCQPGFNGSLCDNNIDECGSSPCRNGGTCRDAVNNYTCACAAGYTGNQCETDINDCQPNPCSSLQSCVDAVNGYSCCLLGLISCQGFTFSTTTASTAAASFTTSTAAFVTNASVTNSTAAFVTTASVTNSTAAFVTTASVTNSTAAFVTTASVTNSTAAFVTTASVTNSTAAFVTTASVTNSTAASVTTASTGTTASPSTAFVTTALLERTSETTAGASASLEGEMSSATTSITAAVDGSSQPRTEPATTAQQRTKEITSSATSTPKGIDGTQAEQTTAAPVQTTFIAKQCACRCRGLLANVTQEELARHEEEVRKELSVDKKHLSRSVRKVTSADDDRPSAMSMGYAGLVFLVCSFAAILLLDLTASCRVETKKPAAKKTPPPADDT